jgi:hypothetical protein
VGSRAVLPHPRRSRPPDLLTVNASAAPFHVKQQRRRGSGVARRPDCLPSLQAEMSVSQAESRPLRQERARTTGAEESAACCSIRSRTDCCMSRDAELRRSRSPREQRCTCRGRRGPHSSVHARPTRRGAALQREARSPPDTRCERESETPAPTDPAGTARAAPRSFHVEPRPQRTRRRGRNTRMGLTNAAGLTDSRPPAVRGLPTSGCIARVSPAPRDRGTATRCQRIGLSRGHSATHDPSRTELGCTTAPAP